MTVLLSCVSILHSQTTIFTYQGRLNDSATAATGLYDLRFTLFDSPGGTNIVGGPLTNAVTSVANGLFTVPLDFGSAVFSGADRWLEIGVRSNASASPYQTLSPRQMLTSTPYAIRASAYSGAVTDSQLSTNVPRLNGNQSFSGVVSFNGPFNSFTGTFAGNGLALTNLNASSLATGTVPNGRLAGTYSNPVTFSNVANNLSGNGSGLTSLNASSLASGTVPDARLSGTYSGTLAMNNPANSFSGNGSGLGNLGGISNGAVSITMLTPSLAQRIGVGPYGYGTDSNVTLSGTTTLTRDMFYSNLTLNAGATILNTAGYRVFVRDTCTIGSGAVIRNDGNGASGAALGTGGPTGTLGGGGSGGPGAINSSNGTTNIVDSVGGNGGNGGSGGVGGTATPVTSANGGPDIIKTFPNATQGRQLAGGVVRGGAGGGSGLGSGGQAGGGGGGGGGVVMLAAHIITGSGTVQAKGGNGGSGSPGGGGGGGGGCVIVVTDLPPTGLTFSAAGGSGGSASFPGVAGSPGTVVLLY